MKCHKMFMTVRNVHTLDPCCILNGGVNVGVMGYAKSQCKAKQPDHLTHAGQSRSLSDGSANQGLEHWKRETYYMYDVGQDERMKYEERDGNSEIFMHLNQM